MRMLRRPALAIAAGVAGAQSPDAAVLAQARANKAPLLDTLKDLVSIESGSRDLEGLAKLSDLIAARLKALGGTVELIESKDVYKMEDTPEKTGRIVRATFRGTGTKKVMLLAHMDTVYPKGMAAGQPFKIEGDRVYGLGIADARGGLATILHTLSILKQMNYRDYGTLTVFFMVVLTLAGVFAYFSLGRGEDRAYFREIGLPASGDPVAHPPLNGSERELGARAGWVRFRQCLLAG